MSKELLNTAHNVVREARRGGADGVRATVYRYRNSQVEWRESELERVRESTTMGASLTLYLDGRYSAHSTSDMTPEGIQQFVERTIAMTRHLARDEHRRLPDPSRYQNQFRGDLQNYDPRGSASITGGDRRRIARSLVETIHASPGANQIVSAKSSCSDSIGEQATVVSNGMEGVQQNTFFFVSGDVSVRDTEDRRPRGFWSTGGVMKNMLDSPELVGREALRRALSGIGQKRLPTGTYPCVIENRAVGRLLGDLSGPLGGNAIQQQRSFLADKMGEQIASPIFTVIDDPHLPQGSNSSIFDGEGMSTRRRAIIERGVLRTFFLDTYYASKLGTEPTTGGPSNMVFQTGTRSRDEMLRAMGTGLLITGFMGGNSNAATGDFSIAIRGHYVESGEIIHPVAEMNLGGSHLELWKQVLEMGNDPHPYSSVKCPSVRFGDLQFSGV